MIDDEFAGANGAVIDVVVVAWNAAEHIGACLAALAQSSGVVLQVRVIDNDSSDDTLALVRSSADSWPVGHRLDVVANDANLGFAGAANQGWAAGSAPWVMTLNPDVELAPDALKNLVAAGLAHPEAGWLAPILVRDDATIDSAGHSFHHPRLFRNKAQGLAAAAAPGAGYVFGATGAAALYRRSALDAAAAADPAGRPWDEGCFAYWEDVDLDWRLQRLGFRCWFEPAARGRHVRGVARRRAPDIVEMLNYRNRFRVIWRNDSWLAFLLHLPGFLLTTLLKTGDLLVTHPRALFAAMRSLRFGARPRGTVRPKSERFDYRTWLGENARRLARRD